MGRGGEKESRRKEGRRGDGEERAEGEGRRKGGSVQDKGEEGRVTEEKREGREEGRREEREGEGEGKERENRINCLCCGSWAKEPCLPWQVVLPCLPLDQLPHLKKKKVYQYIINIY